MYNIINYIDNTITSMTSSQKYISLKILNWFHFFIDVFILSYLFIFSVYYDFYLIIFIFFQALHWLILKNECIISYTEKKLINQNYKLGYNISYIPHENEFYFNSDILIFIKTLLMIIILIFIYERTNGFIKYLLLIEIFIIIYITILKYIRKFFYY